MTPDPDIWSLKRVALAYGTSRKGSDLERKMRLVLMRRLACEDVGHKFIPYIHDKDVLVCGRCGMWKTEEETRG